jgi:hypothetical protein
MLTKPIREQAAPLQTQQQQRAGSAEFAGSSLAVHKQAFYSIAKIIAALTVANQKEGQAVIKQLIDDLKVRVPSGNLKFMSIFSVNS